MPAGDERRFPRFLRGWAIVCGLSRSAGKRCHHARSACRTAEGCGTASVWHVLERSEGRGWIWLGAPRPSLRSGRSTPFTPFRACHPKSSAIVVRTFHVRTEPRVGFDGCQRPFSVDQSGLVGSARCSPEVVNLRLWGHVRSVGRTAGGCGNAETLSRRITSAGSPASGFPIGVGLRGARSECGTPWSAAKGVVGSASALHALHSVQGVPPQSRPP